MGGPEWSEMHHFVQKNCVSVFAKSHCQSMAGSLEGSVMVTVRFYRATHFSAKRLSVCL